MLKGKKFDAFALSSLNCSLICVRFIEWKCGIPFIFILVYFTSN